MRYVTFIFLFFSFLLHADVQIEGEWGVYCGSSSKIYVKNTQPAMVLVDGHTYIYTKYRSKKNNEIEIYYKDVIEGGLPGKDVPWSYLSKEIPIGIFNYVSEKKATLKWFGFETTNSRKVSILSDFSDEKINTLTRCR